jgi:hypothetical protein
MARDAVAITPLASGAGTTNPAGTAITPANGANIPNTGDTSRLVVRVTNTNGTQRTVTFKAGASPPAVRSGLGDLAVVVPATTGDKLVVLESARFAKADGSIDVDFEASMAGVISAVRIPKGV